MSRKYLVWAFALALVLALGITSIAFAADNSLKVTMALSTSRFSAPAEVTVSISVSNVGESDLPGPATLYYPSGRQVEEFGSPTLAAGATKSWTGTWKVTQSELEAGKVTFSVKYTTYDPEGTVVERKKNFSCKIVYSDPEAKPEIELDITEMQLKENESVILTATVKPEGASRTVQWVSGDSSIAEVDQKGTVTWKGPGKTVIIAMAQEGGLTAACTVICLDTEGGETDVCPACGNPVKDGQKFCGVCGADLTGAQGQKSGQISGMKPKAGSIITFGRYPQTASGTDSTPIEWIVLDYDPENNRALLISRYGLDAQPYNTSMTDVTWEKCTLRTWLNGTFLNKAFTALEKSAILMTNVDNSTGQGYSRWNTIGGRNTQDKIFLLSYAQANRYFGANWDDISNMRSRVAPTAYAAQQGALTNNSFKTADDKTVGWWWLRSPGYRQEYAANVYTGGALRNEDVSNSSGCVRPALWISLGSDIF